MRARSGLCAALAIVLTACTTTIHSTGSRTGSGTSSPSGASASRSGTTAPSNCPSSYVQPDPKRPRVTLEFTISDDLTTVTGTEHVQFTPDLPIRELVFRLTANTPSTVAAGNRIQVTSAKADHDAGAATYSPDGAAADTQGGLLRIPFPKQLPAGTTVTADLAFTLTLGLNSFDRFGRYGDFAWFASAHPLLAWERGYGWHTEPMLQFPGAESATSEAAQTDLTVVAPAADTVIMSGDPSAGTAASSGTRRWHASLAASRDVSVAVGPFVVRDTVVNGVKLRVGAFNEPEVARLVPLFRLALTQLSARFGPYPFPSLSVARPPVGGGGIEYPSSILMLDSSQRVAVHETAHQWFYAMVGDSQAQHAWLDEAFASYAEQLVDHDPPPTSVLNLPGRVDTPTAAYGHDVNRYYAITYGKGAAALHQARAAAGPAKFDAAIRCFVNADAWRIAEPDDLKKALDGLPAAVSVLRQAGALN